MPSPRSSARGVLLVLVAALTTSAATAESQWPVTEGAAGGGRYSPLRQIDRTNIDQLVELWRYRHGDFFKGGFPLEVNRGSAFESTPILVENRLVLTTPRNRVIALDPETGAELWAFDPSVRPGQIYANMWINRGVAAWYGASETRIFLATLDGRLIALDAETGLPAPGFGREGTVDIIEGIAPLADRAEWNATSPPTIVGDVVIVGSSIADTLRPDAPPGDVRAYDARTGERRWTFHTVPHAGEPGYETWDGGTKLAGAANVWSTITADLDRGLVYLPVSTPSPDYYGGDRPGANLYSDSLVALEAATGRVRWHFQTVHHDLWDYDLAAPPVLVTVERDGVERDAVVQVTKTSMVFIFDRETGEPLFEIEERPVPVSSLPGERSWPTQPFPVKPPPLSSHGVKVEDLYAPNERHRERCEAKFSKLRSEGIYTPASEQGTIVRPYSGGGANWSGAAWDPERRRLFVPVADLAHVIQLRHVADQASSGGTTRPLQGFTLRGIWFILTGRGTGLRYQLNPLGGRTTFAVDSVPCTKPPWGRLVAVDLDRGEIDWSASTSIGPDDPGLHGYGPPLSTGGGLLFHAGTRDPVLRIHDADTGELVAKRELPAGLHAGPISYSLADGRQVLLVAPGGHVGLGSPLGDFVIAYALPSAPDVGQDALGEEFEGALAEWGE
jgi:quinoprotein glucose dehydrogenase